MTMTLADLAPVDDGGMTPRELTNLSDARFTAEYKAEIMAEHDAADRRERARSCVGKAWVTRRYLTALEG